MASLWLLLAFPAAGDEIDPAQLDFFENRIRPLLVEKCYKCHSAAKKSPKGGLLLDSKSGWSTGGDSGPALRPGNPGESLLMKAVGYEDPDLQMPPRGKLDDDAIADLWRWIAMGAPDPRVAAAVPKPAAEFDLEKRRAAHWAWQPVVDHPPPAVRDGDWPRAALDRFILARLEAGDLVPAAAADRRTYLRRLTFDLTGLPPAPEELDAFVADRSPTAFERAVDRLLASPHLGERWGQHWLDLVRYAETRGHEQDFPIPEAFRYRDYTIRAFNSDVPYDRLVVEHLAGDLLERPRIEPHLRTNESIQGTGFWHLGEATHSPVDIRGEEADRIANQVDVFSRTFLGLSMACARCHDHKFDAISTKDFYAFCGFLQSSSYQLADVSDPETRRKAFVEIAALKRDYEARILDVLVDVIRAQTADLPLYLLEAGVAGAGSVAPAGTAEAPRLDRERRKRWIEALDRAANDPKDVLFAFASIARASTAATGDRAPLTERVLAAWEKTAADSAREYGSLKAVRTIEDGERNYVKSERPLEARDVVVDFSRPGPEDWLTSGERFGDGPAESGDVVLGGAEQPVTGIVEEGAAASDLLSERFTGMLRTRTFEVTSDTLWYRYRGKADVFLAVDSHRVVAGPLHGVVKQELKGDGDYRWHAHNVRDYIGHRVHVEFTPREGFSLATVQFADRPPPSIFRPNERLVALVEEPQTDSVERLAEGYRRAFRDAISDLAADRLVTGTDEARDAAQLVNWLLAHRDLLAPAGDAGERLRALAAAYERARHSIENGVPAPVRALASLDGSALDEYVHVRGNHRNLASEAVPRRALEALDGHRSPPPATGSGRLQLARRLVDPTNPLTRRVVVNRIWHHLFGRGIVPTVDDFGTMGKPPSHPELLDHLATRLLAKGWSIKSLVREIVLSSTYRMSSTIPEPNLAIVGMVDPTNKLLHRMPIRRLTAESIRDAMLAASGTLDRRLFGKSTMVHITPFMRNNRSPSGSGPLDGDRRRSIYIEIRRNHLSSMLVAFDKPVPFTTIGKRHVSNSPAQPLILMNDPFVHQQAERWATDLLQRTERGEALLRTAYMTAFARPPAPWETELGLQFLEEQRRQYPDNEEHRAWTDLCHTLMNVKEFLYLR